MSDVEQQPPPPPPPWQRVPPERRRRRGRDPITRELIVEKALALLDRDGLGGLSMRRLANELDTGPASLYWHVGSKDGLLDLVFDRVIGEQRVPDPEPERWQEQLKEIAVDVRQTILRHRDLVRISIGRYPLGPNALRYTERVLAVLRAGGVDDRLAVIGMTLLFAIVNGFTLDETVELGTEGAEPVSREAAEQARDYLAGLPVERFPNLVAVADHFVLVDNDRRFEILIDLFVDGLAQQAARGRAR